MVDVRIARAMQEAITDASSGPGFWYRWPARHHWRRHQPHEYLTVGRTQGFAASLNKRERLANIALITYGQLFVKTTAAILGVIRDIQKNIRLPVPTLPTRYLKAARHINYKA